MKYAWYGKKFLNQTVSMIIGGALFKISEAIGLGYFMIAIIVIGFLLGFARETKSADGYWFKHNRSDGE